MLLGQGQHFVLNHDFAFPDLSWIIEHFRGELTLDPAWQARAAFEPVFEVMDPHLARGGRATCGARLRGPAENRKRSAWRSRPACPTVGTSLVHFVLPALPTVAAVIVIRQRRRGRGRFLSAHRMAACDRHAARLDRVCASLPSRNLVGAAWHGAEQLLDPRGHGGAGAARARRPDHQPKRNAPAGGSSKAMCRTCAGMWMRKTLPLPERKLIEKLFFYGAYHPHAAHPPAPPAALGSR